MSSYDFIIDGIRFSHSALTTFEGCNYAYKLTYIEALPRMDNFYGEYGRFIHECNEKYFRKELDAFELSSYYFINYDDRVKSLPPDGFPGMAERYREEGQTFYDNFVFDRDAYDILLIEEAIDFDLDDFKFVAKPDLVLRNRESGKVTLYDYKTAVPFKEDRNGGEKVDKKKMDGYYRQMFIYSYALRNHRGIPVDDISLWFVRAGRTVTIPWDARMENNAINWIGEKVDSIKKEETFMYNNSNSFFCNNLCSVRQFCEYR